MVPDKDPVALADAIERYIGDRKLAAEVACAGRRRIVESFDVVAVVSELLGRISAPVACPESDSKASEPNLPRSRCDEQCPPLVTVIVPCRNEEKWIGPCLQSILANDYPKDRLEVLVADGMSSDGTRGVIEGFAAKYPFIRLLSNQKRIAPAA